MQARPCAPVSWASITGSLMYLSRCGAKKPIASAAPEEKATPRGKVRPEHCGQEKRGDFR